MNTDFLQSFLRMGLNGLAGYLVQKGIGDSSTWDIIIAGVVAAVTLGWSYFHRQQVKATAAKAAIVAVCPPQV